MVGVGIWWREVKKETEEKPVPRVVSSQSFLLCLLHFLFFYCSYYSRHDLFEKRLSTDKRLISLTHQELIQTILKTRKMCKGH